MPLRNNQPSDSHEELVDLIVGPYALLVTGDRFWLDGHTILRVLHKYPRSSTVLHGNAHGADRIAKGLASYLGMRREKFPYITELGRAGGPARNGIMVKRMVELSHVMQYAVLAFHNDLFNSRGTLDCVTKALRADLTVMHYKSGVLSPDILTGPGGLSVVNEAYRRRREQKRGSEEAATH